MQVLYLITLWSIKTNLDEKKTEFQVNHNQQTVSDVLAYSDLFKYSINF